jgi:6-pyruvoyltetrahydropterin/6-carboxytetrahydropterin synthase
MKYRVTKTYDHSEGLSCVFRQPSATSHCRLLHGYALGFEFEFGADTLDHRNWVIDFGSFKPLREWLHETFDHTLVIDSRDPEWTALNHLDRVNLARTITLAGGVGCEKFAELAYHNAVRILRVPMAKRVKLLRVTVREHGGNSASYVEAA